MLLSVPEVIAGLPRDGDAADLSRMLELPVATAARYLIPPILVKHSEHLTNFHEMRISMLRWVEKAQVLLQPNIRDDAHHMERVAATRRCRRR